LPTEDFSRQRNARPPASSLLSFERPLALSSKNAVLEGSLRSEYRTRHEATHMFLLACSRSWTRSAFCARRSWSAGDDVPSSNTIAKPPGMEQDADAAAADGFVGVESRDMDQNGAAEPVHSEQEPLAQLAQHAPAEAVLAQAPVVPSMTMLDVALAWRELPASTKCKELALLRLLHANAHGADCVCSAATSKATPRWRVAIQPATRDRKPPGPHNRLRWKQTPFRFDFYTMSRPVVEAGPSVVEAGPSDAPSEPPVDPAAAAAAASEQLPLYLRRGQGPPTITHWNPLGEICLPFLFCFFYLSVRLTVSLFLSLFLFFFLYLSVSLSFSLSLSLSLYLPACQHLLRGNCPWGLLTFS
jgi:hypothetical protein